MIRDDGPDHVISYLVILVSQDISDAADLFPRHVGRKCDEVIRQVARPFGDDLERSLDREFEQPILLELGEALSKSMRLDADDGVKHFGKNRPVAAHRDQKTRTAESSIALRS